MRADAARNRALLVDAAKAVFGEQGEGASLDEIARRAGVGAGTLYRHFPTRLALQRTVLRENTEALVACAGELLAIEPDPLRAMETWLRKVAEHSTTYRGLARSVLAEALAEPAADGTHVYGGDAGWKDEMHGRLYAAGGALLERAQHAGAIRADLQITEALRLANAVALAIEQSTDPAANMERLLALVLDGLRSRCDGSDQHLR